MFKSTKIWYINPQFFSSSCNHIVCLSFNDLYTGNSFKTLLTTRVMCIFSYSYAWNYSCISTEALCMFYQEKPESLYSLMWFTGYRAENYTGFSSYFFTPIGHCKITIKAVSTFTGLQLFSSCYFGFFCITDAGLGSSPIPSLYLMLFVSFFFSLFDYVSGI